MYNVPSSFKAGRDLVVAGTVIAKDTVLDSVTIGKLKTFSSLVAKRWVIPVSDPSARRTKETTPTPTYINPNALNQFFGSSAPVVPTNVVAVPGNHQVTLTFDHAEGPEPDAYDFWALYKPQASNDSAWELFYDGTSTSHTIVVTGLTNGVYYDFRVLAQNANGNSAQSYIVRATPATTPTAPTINTITGGTGQLTVNFTGPSSDGGTGITNYKYSVDGGAYVAFNPIDVTSPLIITGLTAGTKAIRIKATNGMGDGAASNAVNGTVS